MKTIFRTLAVLAFFISFLSFSHSALAASAAVKCPAGYTCTPINAQMTSGRVLSATADTTQRIAYWWGKVNQHITSDGTWATDPDGNSGANLDKLAYCKKWYPNTVSIQDYQTETIDTWKNAGNIDGPFTASVTTTQCVQPTMATSAPISITVLSPNGGQTFTAGDTITVTWKTENVPSGFQPSIVLDDHRSNSIGGIILASGIPNNGSASVTLPTASTWMNMAYGTFYKIRVAFTENGGSNGPFVNADESDNLLTINGPSVPSVACAINSFSADQSTVAPGTVVTLSWNTNCGYVGIQNMDGFPGKNFGTTSSSNTTVSQTTTYTLYGSNDSGCTGSSTSSTTGKQCTYATKAVTVTAKSADVASPTVMLRVNGSHDPSAVAYKSKLAVTWTTKNAVSCTAYGHWVPVWNSTNQVWNNSNISTNGSMDLMAALAYNADVSQLQFNSSLQIGIQCYGSGANSSVTDMVTVPVYQSSTPVTTNDPTPRIAYWSGKVNQHMSDGGVWISDPDGTSGASINTLTYCQKWYPNTTSVENYKTETINTWKRAAGYEQSDYSNAVMTMRCVQGTASSSIIVILPEGGKTYNRSDIQSVGVTFTSSESGNRWKTLQLFNSQNVLVRNLLTTYPALGSGSGAYVTANKEYTSYVGLGQFLSNDPDGKYKIRAILTDTSGNVVAQNDSGYFTIGSENNTCATSTPSVTVLSPNGGEVYQAGQQITVKWNNCNIPAGTPMFVTLQGDSAVDSAYVFPTPLYASGSYIATLPSQTSWQQMKYGIHYRIRVGTWTGNGQTSIVAADESDALFTINGPTTGLDQAPRIAYWWGKVNQHTDTAGNWVSDPDGTSGADLDKLTYCKKWYPNTTSVENSKTETIGTFKRAAGYEQSDYSATVQTYNCVQGRTPTPQPTDTASCAANAQPSITVLYPNGREAFQSGQQIAVQWITCNVSRSAQMHISVYNPQTGASYYLTGDPHSSGTPNDGIEAYNLSQGWSNMTGQLAAIPNGTNYVMAISTDLASNGPTIIDYSDAPFTIGATGTSGGVTTSTGTGANGAPYNFNRTLQRGISGDDVKALQQRLQQEGVYTGPVTGYFGSLTAGAVSKFQTLNNLPPVGILGPKTRGILNQ